MNKRIENPCVAGSIPALPNNVDHRENITESSVNAVVGARQELPPESAQLPNKARILAPSHCGKLVGAKRRGKTSLNGLSKRRAWHNAMGDLPGIFTSQMFPVVANLREHWAPRARRTKKHRAWGKLAAMTLPRRLPATILITRYSCVLADSDGLASAFKAVRDGIADAFGVADSPASPMQFFYAQELCPRGCAGVRIQMMEST